MALAAASTDFIAQYSLTMSTGSTPDSTEALVLGVQSTDDGPKILAPGIDQDVVARLEEQLGALGVKGKSDEVTKIAGKTVSVDANVVVLTGLGSTEAPAQGSPRLDDSPHDSITAEALRRAAGAATARLADIHQLTVALPAETPEQLSAIIEGAAIGTYSFDGYKTKSEDADDKNQDGKAITFVTSLDNADQVLKRANALAQATFITRDLVNTAPSHLFPGTFAEEVAALMESGKVQVTIYDEEDLAEGDFGGLLGVGQGSANPPRLVKLDYVPENPTGHIALVGKGITFDTGGISLKPAGSMETMKSDMAGAATVTGVMHALAELEVGTKVTGWLAMAENMPSSTAIKPSDILRIRGGKTVEVMNTDAEGRLVLADALVAATEENPDVVVDIATLTGAAMVALGVRTTGIMGADSVRAELSAAALASGEITVELPIPEEARGGFDSNVADLKNTGERFGGMQGAAAFLREFVGETPWAHLDIAGPSFNESSPRGYLAKDATGTMVRTLIRFVENRA